MGWFVRSFWLAGQKTHTSSPQCIHHTEYEVLLQMVKRSSVERSKISPPIAGLNMPGCFFLVKHWLGLSLLPSKPWQAVRGSFTVAGSRSIGSYLNFK